MTSKKQLCSSIPVWTLLLFCLVFTSCESNEGSSSSSTTDTGNGETADVITAAKYPTTRDKQAMFFLAWLADCTAGDAVVTSDIASGENELKQRAIDRITGALADQTLIDSFGNFGSEPVWGPVLRTSYSDKKAVVTDNLMYVVKSEEANEITFSIGISGTNSISYYGWFDEDFNVDSTVPWTAPNNQTHGSISKGSNTGLDILMGMSSQVDLDGALVEMSVLEFIMHQITVNPESGKSYKVKVAGHSLGGALTPLVALRIKENLVASKTKTTYAVEAWPYAGPTPGGKEFASYLISTLGDNYYAFINNYDVVPHAWQLSELDRLCKIFVDQKDSCYTGRYDIYAGSIASGIARWAIGQSKASGIEYQMAGTPTFFNGNYMPTSPGLCDSIHYAPGAIKKKDRTLYDKLIAVDNQCDDTNYDSNKQNIRYFFLYFKDLGYQHTSAYELEFFPTYDLRLAVSKYTKGASSKEGKALAGEVLYGLLDKTLAYLQSANISDCHCPTSK